MSERDVSWSQAREFLRGRFRVLLAGSGDDALEDLAQEGLVRLLRALRAEQALNLEALMTTIAKRTYVDHVRRRRVQRARFETLGETAHEVADPAAATDAEIGDPVARVRFIVMEFFASRHAVCLDLARAFFGGAEWTAIAFARGLRPDAVRQQWLRCVGQLRKEAHADKGLLRAWAQVSS